MKNDARGVGMKAVEFVELVGLAESKRIVRDNEIKGLYRHLNVCHVDLPELKRLVESWELVESYGSINQAKQAIIDGNNHCMFIDLEQAIADVESVGGGV